MVTIFAVRIVGCTFEKHKPDSQIITFSKTNETVIQNLSLAKALNFFYGYNTQMDFFLPEDNLTRAVPEETKISSLSAQPYPDGRRLRVNIEITPFQQRPYIEVILHDSTGSEIASTSIVEPMSWKLEFTMHIRGQLNNPYALHARLYYPEGPSKEPLIFSFDVEPPSATASDSPEADPA